MPVIVLAGDLDLLTAPVLQRALKAVSDAGSAPLVLDVSDLAFMDCAGLRILDAYARGGRLHLVRPAREVRRLLELTRYDDAHIHDTVEEAVAAASQHPGLLSEANRHNSSSFAGT
jgi:anti-sigma B factor antagonist